MLIQGQKWVQPKPDGSNTLSVVKFEIDTDKIKSDDVVIENLATSATYTDLLVINGNYVPKFPFPVTPGYDLTGKVVFVGKEAEKTQLKVGDLVAAMPQHGGQATHIVLNVSAVYKIDIPTIDPLKASTVVLTGVTAYQMLHRAQNRLQNPKDSVILVHACVGATGAMLVSLAKVAGVKTVIGTCSKRNFEAAKKNGCDVVLDYADPWDGQVLELFRDGVDVVFDPILLNGNYKRGLKVLRKGGFLVGYGVTDSKNPGTFSLLGAMATLTSFFFQNNFWYWFDGKEVTFYNVSDRRKAIPEDFKTDLQVLMKYVHEGKINPLENGKVWSFDQVKDALAAIETPGGHRGRQIIDVRTRTTTPSAEAT
jgi:NADPH:quinone reductase-like Zn-dependent oxidoreductase